MKSIVLTLVLVGCSAVPYRETSSPNDPLDLRAEDRDAVMLSDSTAMTWSGTAWTPSGTGATANVIVATAGAAGAMTAIGRELVFEGVTAWTSEEGPDTITLTSDQQALTARFDTDHYVVEGLVPAAAFGASPTLTAEAGGASAEVEAPPALPADWLGAPEGLATTVRLPDGSFDGLFVYALAAGSATPGDAGAIGFVAAEDLVLEAGHRTGPILAPATVAELEARGLVPTDVWVGPMNVTWVDGWFDREVPLQAGRLVQLSAADLDVVVDPPDAEPCDHTMPQEVEVGATVSSAADGCADKLHYYRFTPPTAGAYTIEKTGGRFLGFCTTEDEFGCICAGGVNCCVDCTLDFVLPGGDPLPAGTPLQIYVDSQINDGPYTFTVRGPE